MLDPYLICKKSRLRHNKYYYELCKNETFLLREISRGIQSAFKECEHQFKHHRWNCTPNARSMRKLLLKGELANERTNKQRSALFKPLFIDSVSFPSRFVSRRWPPLTNINGRHTHIIHTYIELNFEMNLLNEYEKKRQFVVCFYCGTIVLVCAATFVLSL